MRITKPINLELLFLLLKGLFMENDDNQQPDITITEEYLAELEQQHLKTADFFANPQPRALAPLAIVESLCIQSHRKFFVVFEQKTPLAWTLVRFLDDSLDLSNQPSGATPGLEKDLVGGKIDWSNLGQIVTQCPYCNAKSVVKCGSCGRLSCHIDGKQGSHFYCPWCDHRGHLSGHIQALNASRTKNKAKG